MRLGDPRHDSRVYSRRSDHEEITACLHSSRPSAVRAPAASSPGAMSCPPTEVRCMSSLDHDRLLHEGPEPRKRAGSALTARSGTRSRQVAMPVAETVPAPRRARSGATGRVAAAATKETVSKAAKTAATATKTA